MESETCGICSWGRGYGVEGAESASGEVEEGVHQQERGCVEQEGY